MLGWVRYSSDRQNKELQSSLITRLHPPSPQLFHMTDVKAFIKQEGLAMLQEHVVTDSRNAAYSKTILQVVHKVVFPRMIITVIRF